MQMPTKQGKTAVRVTRNTGYQKQEKREKEISSEHPNTIIWRKMLQQKKLVDSIT